MGEETAIKNMFYSYMIEFKVVLWVSSQNEEENISDFFWYSLSHENHMEKKKKGDEETQRDTELFFKFITLLCVD